MASFGNEFVFVFSHCTKVDAAIGSLGSEPCDVDLSVHSGTGELLARKSYRKLAENQSVTTRGDPEVDNLARFTGVNIPGLVHIVSHSGASALVASALCIGRGICSCSQLLPLPKAASVHFASPVAIGQQLLVLLTNPYDGTAQVEIGASPGGGPFRPVQDLILVNRHQVVISEDVFSLGKPAVLRIRSMNSIPVLAWVLGVGWNRSELYPLHP